MKDISAGYKVNNYIGSRKVRNIFKGKPFEVKIKDININGQKRGCSGFITNTETGKVCYIDTELFFNGGSGSGLYGDKKRAIMMRTAENIKDYRGGVNHFLPPENIVKMAEELTRGGSENDV